MGINKTKVITVPGAGNGLASVPDLEAGDLIIEIANPYIIVVEKASLDKVCSKCLLKTDKLKRCARCKVAQYCSTNCQSTAWKSVHKLECSAMAEMPSIPPTPVRALMQILLTHSFGASSDPRWRDLKSNEESLSKTDRYSDILFQARLACQYTKFAPTNALELAVGILCRMSTNAFRATLIGGDPVGLCFEPVLALANHSCSPNAAIVFSGRKIMLRALDPIKHDEEIFISYVDTTQRRETRQAETRGAYFFTCMCKKCVNDETPYQSWVTSPRGYRNPKIEIFQGAKPSEEPAHLIKSTTDISVKSAIAGLPTSAFDAVETLLLIGRETSDRRIRLKSINQALKILQPFRAFEVYALSPYPSILHELYLYYIDSQTFSIALSLLLFMHLNCHFYLYPQPNHPSNIERLYTIAKLCATMIPSPADDEYPGPARVITSGPKFEKAISSIDWIATTQVLLTVVSDVAPLSHGIDARFTIEVTSMLTDIEGAQEQNLTTGGNCDKQYRAFNGNSKRYALRAFEGLKRLGNKEVVEEIMDWEM